MKAKRSRPEPCFSITSWKKLWFSKTSSIWKESPGHSAAHSPGTHLQPACAYYSDSHLDDVGVLNPGQNGDLQGDSPEYGVFNPAVLQHLLLLDELHHYLQGWLSCGTGKYSTSATEALKETLPSMTPAPEIRKLKSRCAPQACVHKQGNRSMHAETRNQEQTWRPNGMTELQTSCDERSSSSL